jgi:hypothetical protein
MHKTTGVRDPAAAFPLPSTRDDRHERRDANRAVAVSAIGLAATGIVELLLADGFSRRPVRFLGPYLSRAPPS